MGIAENLVASQSSAVIDGAGFIAGIIPERFVEVDSARLLLIVARFASAIDDRTRSLTCFPSYPVARHFTPEYYLQKLDFLVRYPGYVAYELIELHAMGFAQAQDRNEVMPIVRALLIDKEPDRLTLPFRRFWHGAYERLDDVEAWWWSRDLIYTGLETRGGARPQKHYFATEHALIEVQRLVDAVPHARWYADRIDLLYRFFGGLTASEVKTLQYSHSAYRQAQLDEVIPDLAHSDISDAFERVFGEPLEVDVE